MLFMRDSKTELVFCIQISFPERSINYICLFTKKMNIETQHYHCGNESENSIKFIGNPLS